MSALTTRRPGNGLLPLLTLVGACALVLLAWWPIVVVAGRHGQHVPRNPSMLGVGLAHGTVRWPGTAVVVLYAIEAAAVIGILALALHSRLRTSNGRTRVDDANRHLAGTRDMVGLTPAQAKATAARLRPGTQLSRPDDHGVLIGQTLLRRVPLRLSWEDVMGAIAGPRVGKTTCLVIPAIVGYRGPVKTSSNKPDVHDATRLIRDGMGRCWLCDPQHLVDPQVLLVDQSTAGARTVAPWWWNPLADVTSMSTARELVQILIDASTGPDARPDAYFHPTGKTLLINYVFAAALGGASLLDVAQWLRNTDDRTPIRTLTERHYSAAAGEILSVLAKPDKQRDGVLGTAQSWLAVLSDPNYAAWITPPTGWGLPEFSPAQFVRSASDTMYLLSQEGPASAAFITTALNAAINRAAEAYAAAQPKRRLANPVLSVLDEAANTVRDTTLPDKFSHYGAKGLPHLVILQSWSQGEEIWTRRGMNKLWSAANIKFYAGGVAETEFLRMMSDLLGVRDERYWLSSSSRDHRGGHSSSAGEQVRQVPIMDVAKLAALPRGRAVLFSSGNTPALVRPMPWMATSIAPRVEASLAVYEPVGRRGDRIAQAANFAAELAVIDATDRLSADVAAALEKEGVLL
jgi:type IV secretory pathway TraG/TraD family ATPase VirD4